MKKLLAGILLTLATVFTTVGQAPFIKERVINPLAYEYPLERIPQYEVNSNTWEMLAINLAAVILDGLGDGFRDEGHKMEAHLFDALSIAALSSKLFLYEDIDLKLAVRDFTTYVGLRFVFFDATYNIVRGQDIWYYGGNTSLYGKFWNKLDPGAHIMWAKVLVLAVTVTIPFQYNNK